MLPMPPVSLYTQSHHLASVDFWQMCFFPRHSLLGEKLRFWKGKVNVFSPVWKVYYTSNWEIMIHEVLWIFRANLPA